MVSVQKVFSNWNFSIWSPFTQLFFLLLGEYFPGGRGGMFNPLLKVLGEFFPSPEGREGMFSLSWRTWRNVFPLLEDVEECFPSSVGRVKKGIPSLKVFSSPEILFLIKSQLWFVMFFFSEGLNKWYLSTEGWYIIFCNGMPSIQYTVEDVT